MIRKNNTSFLKLLSIKNEIESQDKLDAPDSTLDKSEDQELDNDEMLEQSDEFSYESENFEPENLDPENLDPEKFESEPELDVDDNTDNSTIDGLEIMIKPGSKSEIFVDEQE